jgi:hypothetical protein
MPRVLVNATICGLPASATATVQVLEKVDTKGCQSQKVSTLVTVVLGSPNCPIPVCMMTYGRHCGKM